MIAYVLLTYLAFLFVALASGEVQSWPGHLALAAVGLAAGGIIGASAHLIGRDNTDVADEPHHPGDDDDDEHR